MPNVVFVAPFFLETTLRFVEGKAVRKRIYVPGRLVNLVVG